MAAGFFLMEMALDMDAARDLDLEMATGRVMAEDMEQVRVLDLDLDLEMEAALAMGMAMAIAGVMVTD